MNEWTLLLSTFSVVIWFALCSCTDEIHQFSYWRWQKTWRRFISTKHNTTFTPNDSWNRSNTTTLSKQRLLCLSNSEKIKINCVNWHIFYYSYLFLLLFCWKQKLLTLLLTTLQLLYFYLLNCTSLYFIIALHITYYIVSFF